MDQPQPDTDGTEVWAPYRVAAGWDFLHGVTLQTTREASHGGTTLGEILGMRPCSDTAGVLRNSACFAPQIGLSIKRGAAGDTLWCINSCLGPDSHLDPVANPNHGGH